MTLLGVDVGTTGCKAVVVDGGGVLRAAAYREYPLVVPRPGWAELDPDSVWAAVRHTIAEVTAVAPERPRALAVASLGEAVTPIDAAGAALAPTIVSFDGRARACYERLAATLGAERIGAICGLDPQPHYSVSKWCWLAEEMPDIYRRAATLACWGDLIAVRLGLPPVIDETMATRTMAFDAPRRAWSPEILDAAGIDVAKLPAPAPSGTVIGPVATSVARDLGLADGALLVTGGLDQMCAAYGVGLRPTSAATAAPGPAIPPTASATTAAATTAPGPALLSLGTVAVLAALVPTATPAGAESPADPASTAAPAPIPGDPPGAPVPSDPRSPSGVSAPGSAYAPSDSRPRPDAARAGACDSVPGHAPGVAAPADFRSPSGADAPGGSTAADRHRRGAHLFGVPTVPYVAPGTRLAIAGTPAGGAVLRWYRDRFGALSGAAAADTPDAGRNLDADANATTRDRFSPAADLAGGGDLQVDELRRAMRARPPAAGVDTYDRMVAEAAGVETDLIALPHFAGSRTAFADPQATAALIGLTFATERRHIVRALLEGVALETAVMAERLVESGAELTSVRAAGGGSQAPVWMQIFADVLQLPVESTASRYAAAFGAALLAGAAVGAGPSAPGVSSAVGSAAGAGPRTSSLAAPAGLPVAQRFEPESAAGSRYRCKLARYRDLYNALAAARR